ncbi:putative beta-13 exoglucanase precursor protein [Rutstroemia sp. NJR-2017a BBW]|nr:putative beta-13 exoglucanase precursor protein [Rutstroemia sp. NJR-2017a BBW]
MFFPTLLLCLSLASQCLGQAYWYETITKQGVAPYNPQGASYQVFRNVKDFGAKGDGVTDDTAAINAAIASGSRCIAGPPGVGCASSTNSPAVVYFPAGTYLISTPIVPYYMTQLVGNANALPTIKATAGFSGIALIDADPYGSENPDYGTTNVFYRQVKNFVIDTTNIPATTLARGIHWPTAQATSLQNMVFNLNSGSGTLHQGVFIENGSGGFLTDLVFNGGQIGMNVGSQQFTSRNLTFHKQKTDGLDWGWTYMGLSINNCGIGIDISDGGSSAQQVGSVTVIDSIITNTPIGILTARSSTSQPTTAGSLAIENVVFTNVPTLVKGPSAASLAGTTGTTTVAAWIQGNVYSPSGPTSTQGPVTAFPRPASLLSGSDYYTRSKPQYANLAASQFASVRSAGAKGNGVADDSAAIQSIITSATAAGKVVYFDSGIYKVTTTINIPAGARIVGETYPVIMGAGSYFSDINNPQPVVRVGSTSGETGVVEWSDMMVSTQGATAGATLIQWNLASPSNTPSGMWDVHTRIGGFDGSNLQLAQCPTSAAQPNANCIAAFMSMRITNIASGLYMENVWLWTADHDIDDPNVSQISIFTGRGLSVESTAGTFWLVGTAVEHHSLYQYQFAKTKNIFMGYIQTETPYYQPAPQATSPFPPVATRNDPDFATFCAGKAANCYDAWGLRILDSTDVMIYGAGFYSFFDNYSLTCSSHTTTTYNSNCQTQIFGIDEGGSSSQSYSGSTVYVYGLNTLGVQSMIDMGGKSVASYTQNTNVYGENIIRFIS